LINLAILHYQFESIHPFYDGNGRTGRILNILYLILNELIDVPILYLSSYIIANKPEYYRLLNQTNHTGKWEEWIMFMLKAVESTSKDTITRITNIKDQLDSTIIKVQEKAPKFIEKNLLNYYLNNHIRKLNLL
jgi:Fic family protein